MRIAPVIAVLALTALAFAGLAQAVQADRGIVEGIREGAVPSGTEDAGVILVRANGTTLLRNATCTAGSCTRPMPDAGTEGMFLGDVSSWRLLVCAPGTQTLSGTGKAEAIVFDGNVRRWGAMPEKDKNVTATTACQGFPVEVNGMQADEVRILYRANGIGVSGVDGGALLISLQACKDRAVQGCGQ